MANNVLCPRKGANDPREYRFKRLDNGLEVLVISDPSSTMAAAALNVGVGTMADPSNLCGLAHFCEHMVFLGSEKYPDESAYSEFIASHGGNSNAHTTGENTNFYFDVKAEDLGGALDIFAQFFIAPLFSQSATEREISAVDSEHSKNINTDARRINHLVKTLSSQEYPYHKFATGDKTTLKEIPEKEGIDVREELMKFHKAYYSASIMKLCVLGQEDVETLLEVATKCFAAVPTTGIPVPSMLPEGLDPTGLPFKATPQHVTIVPLAAARNLKMSFPLPPQRKHYLSHPSGYLGNALGHEGPGSVLSLLKKLGWASNLSAGGGISTADFSVFDVVVDLTEEGLEHVEDITVIVFQFIKMMKKEGPHQWLFEELQKVGELTFEFLERGQPMKTVLTGTANMHTMDPANVLCAPYLYQEYRPDLIEAILEELVPSNCWLFVVSKTFEGKTTLKERIYGTEYDVAPIASSVLEAWEACELHDQLANPPPNDFIPTRVSIKPPPAESERYAPKLIRDTCKARVWHKQDQHFKIPEANVLLVLQTPESGRSPFSMVSTLLWTQLVAHELNEFTYAAQIAQLKFALAFDRRGVVLQLSGFDQNIHVLLSKILSKMMEMSIDEKELLLQKDQLMRRYVSDVLKQPYQHAFSELARLLTVPHWSTADKLEALQGVTVSDVERVKTDILRELRIEALIHGNLTAEESLSMIDMVENTLKFSPLATNRLPEGRTVKLQRGCDLLHHIQGPNPAAENSALFVLYQVGPSTPENSNLVSLVVQLLKDDAFTELRTKQQLGYIVNLGSSNDDNVCGIRAVIQSTKDPVYLQQQWDAFVSTCKDKLDSLSEEEFSTNVAALISKTKQADTQLSQETARFWVEVNNNAYMFDRVEWRLKHLETVSLGDVREFFASHVLSEATRRKLSVHVYGNQHTVPEDGSAVDAVTFARTSYLFPSDTGADALARFSK